MCTKEKSAVIGDPEKIRVALKHRRELNKKRWGWGLA